MEELRDSIFLTFLLLAPAYIVGAIIGYFLRSMFSGKSKQTAESIAAVGAVAGAAALTTSEAETKSTASETTVTTAEKEKAAPIETAKLVVENDEPNKESSPEGKADEEKIEVVEPVAAKVEETLTEDTPEVSQTAAEEQVAEVEKVVEEQPAEETPEIVETPAEEEIQEAGQTTEEAITEETPEAVETAAIEQVEDTTDTVLGSVEEVAKVDPDSIQRTEVKQEEENTATQIPTTDTEVTGQSLGSDSVIEQIEEIARPEGQADKTEETTEEQPAEETPEIAETAAAEEIPETVETVAPEQVAETSDSVIGSVEEIAKIDPNSVQRSEAKQEKEDTTSQIPSIDTEMTSQPLDNKSVIEQVEEIARPEGQEIKPEETPEIVESVQEQVTEEEPEAVQTSVDEEVTETPVIEEENTVDEIPAIVEVAQAVEEQPAIAEEEVSEVAIPVAQVAETDSNDSTNDRLVSTSNKGRVVGRDIEDIQDIELEEISESEFARLSKDLPVNEPNRIPSKTSAVDDLKQIKGIGVIAETQLLSMGIRSYNQIANWSDEDINSIDEKLNAGGRIRGENWVGQAAKLSEIEE